MNRLQKKCFLASAGLHLLLGAILLIGPAFVASRNKQDNMPVLDFVPLKTVDSLMSGGGDPNAKPPPAPMEKPQPIPPAQVVKPAPEPPEPVKPPQQPKEAVREPEPVRETPEYSLVPAKDHKKKPFDFTVVSHPAEDTKEEARRRAEAEAQAQEQRYEKALADRRRRLDAAFGNAVNNIADGRSGSTDIQLKGPGGGGVPYANFLQAVKSRYEHAWVVPDGITDDNATVTTSIVIARDGTVVSARVTRASGNAAVDRSVRVTLERVKWAAPLPDDARENQRAVEINFNVAARRALG